MTKEELAALRALEAAATPAPWRPERDPLGSNDWFDDLPKHSTPIESRGTQFALGVAVAGAAERSDAALICAARNALPALLDALDAARALNLEAAKALREFGVSRNGAYIMNCKVGDEFCRSCRFWPHRDDCALAALLAKLEAAGA